MAVSTALLILSTALSTLALVFSLIAGSIATRRSPHTRVSRCELRLDDHDEQLAQALGRIKRMHARWAARDRMDLAKEGTDAHRQQALDLDAAKPYASLAQRAGESTDEWKRRCRIALGTGSVPKANSGA